MATRDQNLRRFVAATILLFFLFGACADGPLPALKGFLRLQTSPTRLISDFTVIAGTGAAFMNAAFVGILGLVVLKLNKISLSGPTTAALFTMMGFALFGKTLLNCVPIIAGVSLSALVAGKKPREYTLIALFSTALGPVVSYIAFEMGFPPAVALPASMILGALAGLIVPPLAIAMLHLHQGYCLYNVGLTAGFIGLFAASIPNAGGMDISTGVQWGQDQSPWLAGLVPALCLVALALAIAGRADNAARSGGAGIPGGAGGAGIPGLWKEFRAVQKLTGRLPSDFCELAGEGGAFLNVAGLGFAYCAYIAAIGAPFNGPVIGGLMTVIGFGLFGKNLRNSLPVFAGLLIAALVFGKSLTESWVVLAFLFGTALAPLSGEFGPLVGALAGFLHLVVVERTGAWHAGMNLYNNGFAAGLTATLIVSVAEWYRTNRRER